MLSKYAAMVKNLRGIIFTRLEEPGVKETLKWLTRKFKYRDLAAPPSLRREMVNSGFKRFREACYPAEELEKLVEIFSSELSASPEAVEAVVLASAHVSPVLAVGEKAAGELAPLTVERVDSRVSLDDRGWKLHFRIADYTVLDAYEWSVTHAEKLWKPRLNLEAFRKERASKIKADVKRYWRLNEGEEKPKPFLLYIDLAYLAAENGSLLSRLRKLRLEKASAGLALEVAVLIPGGIG